MKGLVGIPHIKTISKLVDNTEEWRRQIALANDELAKNSMSREFQTRMKALSASTGIFQNRLFNLSSTIGGTLAPTLKDIMSKAGDGVDKFKNWIEANPELASKIMIVVAAVGGALTAFGGLSLALSFLVYPISQAADITAFKANFVPVGHDQKPMIEQTREIVRSFNHAYQTDVLVEPEGIYPENEAAGRLPGLDGNAKMSKSLNNGIYLADDMDILQKKVMSMYTDPNHIRVEDPGKVEGNMVFHYLDVFGRPEDAADIAAMKEHYQRGGLGDVKTKRYLLEILERELGPIRERRVEFAKDMGEVYRMLQEGCDKARQTAAQTLSEVKSAMGINYFK